MAIKILPYKQGSESAKALSEALNIKQLKMEGSRWKGKAGDFVINWGSSNADHPAFNTDACVLNHPEAVQKATNKLSSFKSFAIAGVAVPEFTEDSRIAKQWLEAGTTVVVRAKLTGHSGEGITIITPDDVGQEGIPRAPLYTAYIKKTEEYRAHVMEDKVFFVQRKARRHEVPDDKVNWQVRNHGNGFIYAHKDVDIPQDAKDMAVRAVQALGLTFGAVDLLKTKRGSWYVLEANTACGLVNETLDQYVEQFKQIIE